MNTGNNKARSNNSDSRLVPLATRNPTTDTWYLPVWVQFGSSNRQQSFAFLRGKGFTNIKSATGGKQVIATRPENWTKRDSDEEEDDSVLVFDNKGHLAFTIFPSATPPYIAPAGTTPKRA